MSKRKLYGVGILGDKYKTTDSAGKQIKEYGVWHRMIERCYSEKFKEKNPCYKNCRVGENFKFYPYFFDWCQSQYGIDKNWELDKDLIIKGNTIYSETTCVFIPKEINASLARHKNRSKKLPLGVRYSLRDKKYVARIKIKGKEKFLGSFDNETDAFNSYKIAKENFIKSLAETWKDGLDPRAYTALMNYKVEMTD